LLSADYIRVRTAIVAALKPHPAAALAVSRALAALEREGAAEVTQRAGKATLKFHWCASAPDPAASPPR
jgi:hypothetical protein